MNNGNKNEKTSFYSKHHNEKGFTLLEVLLAVAITVIILGAGLGVFKYMTDSGSAAAKVAEINSDIQASVNLIRLDLYRVGGAEVIPETIAIGEDKDTYWENNRCIRGSAIVNCDNNPLVGDKVILKGTRGDGGGYVMNPVTPGLVNGHSAMSVLFLDEFARDIDASIQSGSSVEIAGSAINQRRLRSIKEGDLVLLRRDAPRRLSLQHVTGVADSVISFASDNTKINQDLASGFGQPGEAITVQLLRRVTYFLDKEPADGSPAWLMRQVNFRQPVQLIPGVMGFQLTYDMIDTSGGGVPFQQVNIAKDTRGSRQAGTKYSISAVDLHSDNAFFDTHPEKTIDIRRVNINIWADSTSPAAPGNNTQVLLDQTARIALRGYGDFLDDDECAVDAYAEDCPCALLREALLAGDATYDELLAEGCPDFCADAMKAEEAERESIIEMGCPDPCDKDVWFAGCPCAVTLQDVKDGKATVDDLAAQGCPDLCEGDPFYEICPCADKDLAYTSACKYCYNDPFAVGCPCADNPDDPRCPVDLNNRFGSCHYVNDKCTDIECTVSCAATQGNGNDCQMYFGPYKTDPDILGGYSSISGNNPSWFSNNSVVIGDKNKSKDTINSVIKSDPEGRYWFYFQDRKGNGDAEYAVPLISGGSACNENGENCKCTTGSSAYYCYNELYICKDNGKGGTAIYRRPE